ncbi:tyrosine-protein kinase-like [Dendrobates tinctorius]|uniref:tyrosine-protein kinase-like n=1 Tax=Dendrobates tinctorius TaxID=92724 RepID=UPI003CC997EA
MGQTLCRRCCPCCSCCPCHREPYTDPTFPELEITRPDKVLKHSESKFYSFNKAHNDEKTKRNNDPITHQKQIITLKREDDIINGEDNLGFVDTLDNSMNVRNHRLPNFTIEPSTQNDVIHPTNTQPDENRRISAMSRELRAWKVSTYNYKPRSSLDLDIKKGQKVEVIEDRGEWVIARTINRTEESKTGYIPKSYLANEGSLEAEDWYFGSLTKLDAKRYLLQEENRPGSFLVWQKVADDCYYMSVRMEELVRHYKIRQSVHGSFCLVARASFPSLKDLVLYYSDQHDGLCCKLETPCVKLDLPSVQSISHTTVDHLEIDPSSIQKVRPLGSGRFGTVWLGLWNGTTEVAVKELQVTAESLQKTLYGEAETMWKLSHEKLLKLYAVCLQTRPVFIVTEYMPQGTLKKYLQAHQKMKDLPFPQMVDFAVQISQGMDYMERKGCVHRDLRAENILLSAMMSCKIGDFGLARFMDSTSMAITADAQIPIKWTAPEVFHVQKYTSKSDIWSYGVLLVEIITYGRPPFPDKSNGQYREDILKEKDLIPPPETPEKMSPLIRMCWRYQAASRPSFSRIQECLMDLLSPTLGDAVVE